MMNRHAISAARTAAVLFSCLASGSAGAGDRELLVTSYSGDSVLRFDIATGVSLGPCGSGLDGLNGPSAVILGPDRLLYMSSSINGKILRALPWTCGPLKLFADVPDGPMGTGGNGFIVFMPGGDLLVSNFFDNRVDRYDSSGGYIEVFASGHGLTDPSGLCFGPDGHLYVASNDNGRVMKFDGATGAYLPPDFVPDGSGGLENPVFLTFDGPAGDLYVSDFYQHAVRRYDRTTGASKPDFVKDAARLDGVAGIAFGREGYLYVASQNNGRVVRYNQDGQFDTIFVSGIGEPGSLMFLPCPADLNDDGLIDFADYLEFLNRYEAGSRTVDFNGDEMVDFSDYLEFLNYFDAGC